MMIDKRLINTVDDSKIWIKKTVFWNWVVLIGGMASAALFALCLDWAFHKQLSLISAVLFGIFLLVALAVRSWAGRKAVASSYHASVQVKSQLRQMIYQKLSGMPLSQIQDQSTSQLIQIASEGVEQIEVYFGRYLPQLFYSLLAPLTLFLFLVFFSLKTAVILLICVPLIPMSIIAVNKIAKRLLHKYWSIYTGLGSSFLDNLQGLVTLKIYQDDAYKAQVMDKEAEHFRKITMKVLTMQLNSVSIMDLLAYGGAAVGILVALGQYQAGAVSVFTVILFILLSSEFFIPLRLLGSYFHVAMNGKAASDKIFALLDTPVEQQAGEVREFGKQPVTIQIQHLSFAYHPEKIALSNLNLTIEPNRLSVFVGKSGCGKSTLVSLLMGFYQPNQGEILWNGENASNFDRTFFYNKVCLVSHASYIFKGSLKENMLMSHPMATDEQIWHALEQMSLADFIRQNGGLAMTLLSRGENLSGGQIQRLSLARAILHDADCYILDEATSNIDVESEKVILQAIHQLKRHKTIIMISHRLANAVNADQIFVLDQGKLIEQGCHTELMANHGHYARMFKQQSQLENIRQEAHHE